MRVRLTPDQRLGSTRTLLTPEEGVAAQQFPQSRQAEPEQFALRLRHPLAVEDDDGTAADRLREICHHRVVAPKPRVGVRVGSAGDQVRDRYWGLRRDLSGSIRTCSRGQHNGREIFEFHTESPNP